MSKIIKGRRDAYIGTEQPSRAGSLCIGHTPNDILFYEKLPCSRSDKGGAFKIVGCRKQHFFMLGFENNTNHVWPL